MKSCDILSFCKRHLYNSVYPMGNGRLIAADLLLHQQPALTPLHADMHAHAHTETLAASPF